MKNDVKKYLASIGARGGKAGRGKSKARTNAQARKAALARWRKPANSDYTIGARVRGYGVRGTCKGTIVGVSESPAAIQVKWDNEALMSAGAAGRWEEFYNVTLDN